MMSEETKPSSEHTEFEDDLKKPQAQTVLSAETQLEVNLHEQQGRIRAPAELKAAEEAVAEEWEEGDVILDLYEVKGVLGEGGFGKVYLVHHSGWNVDLAVKTPRLRKQDEAGKENFRSEAETWVNLGLHPHIVSCYYVRDLGGIPRVFAEFVGGGSLSDWIRNGKLYEGGHEETLKRILDVAIQFAWGLEYAHERGLVHQDVKPGNVMMTRDGTVKVTDFGLARASASLAPRKESGGPGGTVVVPGAGAMSPAYASSEQAEGQPLTRKTDIWSWGASVLEMFAGGLFWQSGAHVVESLDSYLEDWSEEEGIPKMPEQVVDLLRHCFKQNPDERPKDMADVASSLHKIYKEVSGTEYGRRRPKSAGVDASSLNNRAVSLLDLGKVDEAIHLWKEALRAEPHHPEATYNSGLTLWRYGRVDEQKAWGDSRAALESHEGEWIDDYLLGLIELERGFFDQAVKIFEDIKSQGVQDSQLEAALAAARERSSRSQRLVREFENAGEVLTLCISGDGKYALTCAPDTELKLWDISTGKMVRRFNERKQGLPLGGFVKMNHDGRLAVSWTMFTLGAELTPEDWTDIKQPGLRLWDVTTGECLRVFRHGKRKKKDDYSPTRLLAADISGDGRRALTAGSDDVLSLWDTSSGRLIWSLNDSSGESGNGLNGARFSPNGREILLTSGNQLILLDTQSGRAIWQASVESNLVSAMFSRDGRRVLTAESNMGRGKIVFRLWDVEARSCLRAIEYEGFWGSLTQSSISQDAGYVLLSQDGFYLLLDLETGHDTRLFFRNNELSWGVAFLPSGTEALLSDGEDLAVWEVSVVDDYNAPMAISKVRASEEVVVAGEEYERHLSEARRAFEREDFVAAAAALRRARSLPGRERAEEAYELWSKLYRLYPRKTLRAAWEVEPLAVSDDNITISQNGRFAAVSSGADKVEIWDINENRRLSSLELSGAPESVESIVTSVDPSGEYVLCSRSNAILQVDVSSGALVRTWEGHAGPVKAMSTSLDGQYAISGSTDGTLKLWEVNSGRCVRTFSGFSGEVSSVYLSPYGRHAVSGCLLQEGEADYAVKVWDALSGHCVAAFELSQCAENNLLANSAYVSASMSPDGRRIYTSLSTKVYVDGYYCNEVVNVWDVASGKCLQTVNKETGSKNFLPSGISFDGRFIITELVQVAELEELNQLYSARLAESEDAVAFTADSRFALTWGRRVRRWALDWEIQECETADWDEGAAPYLKFFLESYEGVDWQPHFEQLLENLADAGYGWLRPEGVRRQLDVLAKVSPGELQTSEPRAKTLSERIARLHNETSPSPPVSEKPASPIPRIISIGVKVLLAILALLILRSCLAS